MFSKLFPIGASVAGIAAAALNAIAPELIGAEAQQRPNPRAAAQHELSAAADRHHARARQARWRR